MEKTLVSLWACGVLALGGAGTGQADKIYKPKTDNQLEISRPMITVAGVESPYSIMSAFVLPGEVLRVEASGSHGALANVGQLSRQAPGVWEWTAPEVPGHYDLSFRDYTHNSFFTVRVFVMEPYGNQGLFHGFRVGSYESEALDGNPRYQVPGGMVRVTPENREILVSPHFKLREFLCKQTGDTAQFLVLQTALLVKLENLHEKLAQELGRDVRLHVMSGYRTPRYNKAIGNTSTYSRHLYGDAADIFVDVDGNDWMDDLNGDKKVDTEDAGIMFRAADSHPGDQKTSALLGGLGIYGPKPSSDRGPFIHVDTRGEYTCWNDKRAKDWFARYRLVRTLETGGVE